jgi:hypothetical protein
MFRTWRIVLGLWEPRGRHSELSTQSSRKVVRNILHLVGSKRLRFLAGQRNAPSLLVVDRSPGRRCSRLAALSIPPSSRGAPFAGSVLATLSRYCCHGLSVLVMSLGMPRSPVPSLRLLEMLCWSPSSMYVNVDG